MTEQEMAHVLEICVNPSGNCAKCPFVLELDCCSHLAKETKEYIGKLKAENTALRSAVQYLIDDGAADCCAKCVYCPQPTEEDDDCDCQHKGECVDGMIKWFEEQREEQQGGDRMKQKLKDISLDALMDVCKKYTLRNEKTKDKYCSAQCPFYITAVESKCTTHYMETHPDEEVEISEE